MSKLDLTKYKWFQYAEDAKELTFSEDRHNTDYELELHGGNVFGVMKRAYGIYVVHAHSPDIQFALNQVELTRIMQHSKGWSGKVGRVKVEAGVGGLDGEQEQLPAGWFRIEDLNSSNLNHAIYDSKRKVLYVAFHRGDSWAYENVTKKEYNEMVAAESRGRYFIYRIKYVKPQYMLGKNFDKPPYDVSPQGQVMPPPPPPASHADAPEAKGVKYPKRPAGEEQKPAKAPKEPKAQPFKIPEGMKVNGRAKISITHSAHPGKTATKTWSGVGFEWLGAKNPKLEGILADLANTGHATVDDGKGIAYLTLEGNILIPKDAEEEETKKPSSGVKVINVRGSQQEATPVEKPGHAMRAFHMTEKSLKFWKNLEWDAFKKDGEADQHVYAILKRERVQSEAEIFKLMASLRFSTLVHDKKMYKLAASAVISMADDYPFTTRGKSTYAILRKHVIAQGK